MTEPKATDWAYAAGFVDGEGCIAITRGFVTARNKYVYSVALWTQRELKHRGMQPYAPTPMHSPRQINRQRKLMD